MELVAPKSRPLAEGLAGEALLEWLAAEPNRVRRPIIDVDGEVTLGFNAAVEDRLRQRLR